MRKGKKRRVGTDETDWRERMEEKVERLETMLETMVEVLAEIGPCIDELVVAIHNLDQSLKMDTDSRDG